MKLIFWNRYLGELYFCIGTEWLAYKFVIFASSSKCSLFLNLLSSWSSTLLFTVVTFLLVVAFNLHPYWQDEKFVKQTRLPEFWKFFTRNTQSCGTLPTHNERNHSRALSRLVFFFFADVYRHHIAGGDFSLQFFDVLSAPVTEANLFLLYERRVNFRRHIDVLLRW